MTFGTIQPKDFVVCLDLSDGVIKETNMTELAIIILTMVLLLGAVIVDELRLQADSSESNLAPNWLGKLSNGRSPKN